MPSSVPLSTLFLENGTRSLRRIAHGFLSSMRKSVPGQRSVAILLELLAGVWAIPLWRMGLQWGEVMHRTMARILLTSGPGDWQKLLAEPDKQWQLGYSARTLAHCWEDADGFPPEVSEVLARTTEPLLSNLLPVLAVPEFKVPLPGGNRASQNDVFVLARSAAGPVCIMIEGKVNESFGPTLDEWLVEASPGKKKRIDFLLRTLCIVAAPKGSIRYQLLHRAASAIITGEQYRAVAAIVLVHSFSEQRIGWQDYEAFADLFRVHAEPDVVQRLTSATCIPLFAAWVTGDRGFLSR
jgi:Domain of unknown function (DUF6946)